MSCLLRKKQDKIYYFTLINQTYTSKKSCFNTFRVNWCRLLDEKNRVNTRDTWRKWQLSLPSQFSHKRAGVWTNIKSHSITTSPM